MCPVVVLSPVLWYRYLCFLFCLFSPRLLCPVDQYYTDTNLILQYTRPHYITVLLHQDGRIKGIKRLQQTSQSNIHQQLIWKPLITHIEVKGTAQST